MQGNHLYIFTFIKTLNMINLSSLESFNQTFKDELSCIQYLWTIRLEVHPGCPKCGELKLYTNSNGKNKKCSSPKCRYGFSVTSKSIILGTRMPLLEWLSMIYLYMKSKGRCSIAKYSGHTMTFATVYMIEARLRIIFEDIPKTEVTENYIFNEAVKNLFKQYGKVPFKRQEVFSGKIYNNVLDSSIEIDFNDAKHYSDLVIVANKLLAYGLMRRWYFFKFCSAEDIVSETFLSIADMEEHEKITGFFVLKVMKKTMQKMWDKCVKDNPNIDTWIKRYKLRFKQDGRMNMAKWYINSLIKSSNNNTWDSSNSINELIKSKRESLKKKREKRGTLTEYEFIHLR